MKTKWDYTLLADAYLKRSEYSPRAIERMLEIAEINAGDSVCDIGAGTANLTLPLLDKNLKVVAIEPNDAMRKNGVSRTSHLEEVVWLEGTGENTGQPNNIFDLVTFGSSFNVVDRELALVEVKRIAKSGGWFACMWNHRDISDPIQKNIEDIIRTILRGFDYGVRREDQTKIIHDSNLFHDVTKIEETILVNQSVEECIEAWRSHGTLHRQAGDQFSQVIQEISEYLQGLGQSSIEVPYTTRLWLAQLKG